MARDPKSIIEITSFVATPDQPYVISITQLLLLYPFFRWNGDHYVDATGDFDLCMSEDGVKYTFINRRSGAETFAYRYIPTERIKTPTR